MINNDQPILVSRVPKECSLKKYMHVLMQFFQEEWLSASKFKNSLELSKISYQCYGLLVIGFLRLNLNDLSILGINMPENNYLGDAYLEISPKMTEKSTFPKKTTDELFAEK